MPLQAGKKLLPIPEIAASGAFPAPRHARQPAQHPVHIKNPITICDRLCIELTALVRKARPDHASHPFERRYLRFVLDLPFAFRSPPVTLTSIPRKADSSKKSVRETHQKARVIKCLLPRIPMMLLIFFNL